MLTRLLTGPLLALGLSTAAHATDLGALTDADREAFRAEVRAYLLDNPEVLMEAIAVLEQREQLAQAEADVTLAQTHRDALFDDGFSYVGGNPDGDVTIVEFMDYRCGYCKRAFPEVEELIATDGNIRFVIKEFPILGEQSMLSAQFAIATQQVAGDAAYKLVHDALMTFRGDITLESLSRLGAAFDLDSAGIIAAMDSPEVRAVLAANQQLADQLQITGTPTFVFDDQMVRGYVPLAQMETILAQVRAD
jgi:protein-disulfide isomerase